MILSVDQLGVLADLRHAAEEACTAGDGSFHQGDVAVRFVASVRGVGEPWAAEYLEHLTVIGAYEKLRDARRRAQPGRSRRGNLLPSLVSATDGTGRAVLRPLARCHRSDIARLRDEAIAQGDAAKRRADKFDRLLERMDADGSDIVGDLADHLDDDVAVAA